MATFSTNFNEYLKAVENPERVKFLTKLEFLNTDGTVAYSIDNQYKKGYGGYADSRAFIKTGSVEVSLNNGSRRKASIMLDNKDNAFSYAVNHLWHGKQVRLSKGVTLPSGEEFYLPQGVFYLDNPSNEWGSSTRTQSYDLVDKWAYLDGSLFGKVVGTFEVAENTNIFEQMTAQLHRSRFTLNTTTNTNDMIDNVAPVFTHYYDNRTTTVNGVAKSVLLTPKAVSEGIGGNYGNLLLTLNSLLVGLIGYNSYGALEVESSQEDINDGTKPLLWRFTPNSKVLLSSVTETAKPSEVFNDVVVWGETTDSKIICGRATNYDNKSDTNINLIGRKTFSVSSSTTYTENQAVDEAIYQLKKKTALQKSITISCSQLLHLRENRLISIRREDKDGSPTENHLVKSYSLPLSDNEPMSISAVAVTDYPNITAQSIDLSTGVI